MYLKLLEESRLLMEEAVRKAGFSAGDMWLGESQYADVSSSLPFRMGKELKKNPAEIARKIVENMGKGVYIEKAVAAGPYINFYAGERYLKDSLEEILKKGRTAVLLPPKGVKVILEHTSANPTGPLHVGRGRNPVIGDTLARVMRCAGYDVQVQYYVDDMGKQEATIVWGYDHLDLEKLPAPEVDKPDHEVVEVYRAATERRKADEAVEREVSDILSRYERLDPAITEKFRRAVDKCLEGQKMTLSRMNVFYDLFVWESEFVKDGSVNRILEALAKTPYAERKDGALVLNLSSFGMDKEFVLTRADGTSLYTTRDIAYHIWKLANCDEAVNVLGEDQKLAMQRLEATLRMLGEKKLPRIVFYSFVSLPEGRMSTRKGVVVNLDDLLDEAVARAYVEVDKRRKDLPEDRKREIANLVGIGAVRYDIVRVAPEKSITFKWEQALDFEKQGAPFIQYAHARTCSILEKAKPGRFDTAVLKEKEEVALIKKMAMLPYVVEIAARDLKPHLVAGYARELAETFNQFYRYVPVLGAEPELREARLALVDAARVTLANSLDLLGIAAPEEM
ncbi:arginyl-tRNA synthetase [Methanocella conradii HZ254]|uniref:Arginine--tRNA ligase n=1 Tax=Methanocella conradii (strain DSM 24694 / JCM 17849 / CGMCC 1.5162 / HZ254) TaxID=1041930 RepID=H8I6L8_METCZ|nr:arginine--tRNA ligase [Methanocella conradii]AFC98910.1 arginyl-tRNA synthetase [Methanocella conradii HZ254]